MEEMTVAIEVDGIPCVLHRDGLNSPLVLHKLAKMRRAVRCAKEGEAPQIDPMDIDYFGEAIFGDEQWEAILEQIDDKGIFYEFKFVSEAISAAANEIDEVKNC